MNNAFIFYVVLAVFAALLAPQRAPVSVDRGEVIKFTPQQVADLLPAPDASRTDAEPAEAQDAVEPSAVIYTDSSGPSAAVPTIRNFRIVQENTEAAQADGLATVSAHGSRAIAGVTRRESWDTSEVAVVPKTPSGLLANYSTAYQCGPNGGGLSSNRAYAVKTQSYQYQRRRLFGWRR